MSLDVFFGTKAPPPPVICARCGDKIPSRAVKIEVRENDKTKTLCADCWHKKLDAMKPKEASEKSEEPVTLKVDKENRQPHSLEFE